MDEENETPDLCPVPSPSTEPPSATPNPSPIPPPSFDSAPTASPMHAPSAAPTPSPMHPPSAAPTPSPLHPPPTGVSPSPVIPPAPVSTPATPHSPLTVTLSEPDAEGDARVVLTVDSTNWKPSPGNQPPAPVEPSAPVIQASLEEIRVTQPLHFEKASGHKTHTPGHHTAPTNTPFANGIRSSLVEENVTNEKRAVMAALMLEQPEEESKRKLSQSAIMLRSPDRKFSVMEIGGLKDKIRRDHLNACRQFLASEFPTDGSGIRLEEFKKALATPAFLNEFFGLFDHDETDHLKQDDWIDLLKLRVPKPIGFDFVELVESVAYILVGERDVTLATFRRIFSSRGVLQKLFRLIDKDKDDVVSVGEIMEMITNLSNPRTRDNGLTAENLANLEKMFREHMSRDSEIHLEDFKKILNSKNPFFAERVFSIFDRDSSGAISLTEFLEAMGRFATQDHDEKISFLFQIYDVDGDGLIQTTELQAVLRACMDENGMNFSDEQIEDLTYALYEDADAGHEITYDALKAQLMKHEGLLENLSISIERWLVPEKKEKGKAKMELPYQLTMPYIKNNYVYLIFVSLWIATNLILAAKRIYDFRMNNGFVIVARIGGQCLNFNCTFILVLMLRHTLTFLRNHGFASFLPLDQHVYLHKVCGWLILAFGIIHTLAHVGNLGFYIVGNPSFYVNGTALTFTEWMTTSKPAPLFAKSGHYGLITAWANPTGIALIVIMTVIVLSSLPVVRRSGNFEVFYWMHLLYVPFWVLLILHCQNFWKWFIGPGIIFLIERLVRIIRMHGNAGKTNISSGILLPSKVVHLVVKRPHNFYFQPGDYVFVNIPAIAKYEWHAFTISSAPELEDSVWLHIRGVGQWTNRLYSHFETEQAKLENMKSATVVPMEGLLKGLPAAKKPVSRPRSGFQNFKRKISHSIRPNRNSFMVNQEGTANGTAKNNGVINEAYQGTDAPGHNGEPGHDLARTQIGGNASTGDVFLPGTPGAGVETATHRRQTRFMSSSKKKTAANRLAPSPSGVPGIVPPSKRKVEKTKSLPDMEVNMRRRNKNLILREKGRANSEHAFDEKTLKKAATQAFGASIYKSVQNRSVAHSFRYMRRKPTIVALEMPREAGAGASEHQPSSFRRTKDRRSISTNLVAALEPVVETKEDAEAEAEAEAAVRPGNGKVEDKDVEAEHEEEDGPTPGVDFPVGKALEIYLDGPYGAPSSHIFRAQHAVLIGTGIGVTPFASILQSIMHRYWNARQNCPNCRFTWCGAIPKSIMNLRKVDFFWINRDQRSFEWFVELLSQLEMEQAELGGCMERFLDMHMYITSALQKTDMKALGLQLALELLHEKEKRDLITGLKTRTMAGRPNWNKVFQQIAEQNKGKVTVFFCGPPELARTLRVKCHEFGFSFKKESF